MSKPILLNVTEEIVQGLVRFLLHSPDYQTFCDCDFCQMNISADALNHLPTYYVSTSAAREEAYLTLKTPEHIELINKKIIVAIHTVGKKPNHTI
ncbi:late competence development ComFB family protein [Ureibacillus chungkukjangi]|uniref:Competence protein ComFB n=1 Tax=Ureibacillus chungkukjangi TaxID=1202712 RepID=A0A318TU54_9BACL|nr:late competence development ComFB family protein [Ureibacillus chungkukjangi]MCM3389713.1 late competence development ComFB family protein [Ureibacillus chungkukjangi]PYF06588.1 competence protein ComFB [Ureibacillus chungkukjangi]